MTILVTGATGFLGSAWVASLLARGERVRTLSRNDPGGLRVRAAVERAAVGFGLSLEAEHWERLSPVEVDFRDLPGTLTPRRLVDVTEVWNIAAEMSYSTGKILQAVEQNVVAASLLYGLAARHAIHCQRFYQLSTAYTAGFGQEQVREVAHVAPQVINAYQLSKWVAELTLMQQQRDLGLPLTLLRPSIVIGHRQTGWSTGACFGLFSFAEGLLHGKRQQAGRIHLDLKPDARVNLVCIDTVVHRALELRRAEPHREPLEIFHCVADQRMSLAEALEPACHLLGLNVSFGPPQSGVDEEIAQLLSKNKRFADTTWLFHTDRLRKVLGEAYVSQPMNQEIIRRSLTHFLAHRLRQLAAQELPSPLQQPEVQ